jgi:hypothetical protein
MRDPKSAANPPNFPLRDAKFHKSGGEIPPKKKVLKFRDSDIPKHLFSAPATSSDAKSAVKSSSRIEYCEEDMRVGGVPLEEGDLIDAVRPEKGADGCRHFRPATVIELEANGCTPYTDCPFDPGMEVLVEWEVPILDRRSEDCGWVPLDQVPKP